LEFFKVQKEMILTNVCFSTAPMDNISHFHSVFAKQKFTFSARPLAQRSAFQAQVNKMMPGQLHKNSSFLLHQSGKK
jgi:hypothetical protein